MTDRILVPIAAKRPRRKYGVPPPGARLEALLFVEHLPSPFARAAFAPRTHQPASTIIPSHSNSHPLHNHDMPPKIQTNSVSFFKIIVDHSPLTNSIQTSYSNTANPTMNPGPAAAILPSPSDSEHILYGRASSSWSNGYSLHLDLSSLSQSRPGQEPGSGTGAMRPRVTTILSPVDCVYLPDDLVSGHSSDTHPHEHEHVQADVKWPLGGHEDVQLSPISPQSATSCSTSQTSSFSSAPCETTSSAGSAHRDHHNPQHASHPHPRSYTPPIPTLDSIGAVPDHEHSPPSLRLERPRVDRTPSSVYYSGQNLSTPATPKFLALPDEHIPSSRDDSALSDSNAWESVPTDTHAQTLRITRDAMRERKRVFGTAASSFTAYKVSTQ
jgi:hypothetical protein